jgi:hypothetical protein
MKKLLPILFILTFFSKIKAQVVFCPRGAEWHYLFLNNNLSPNKSYSNEKISYVRDSVLGSETVKVLEHKLYFANTNPHEPIAITLIRQRGDTVFMRNKYTLHQWQILYNFNVQAGHSWKTIYPVSAPTRTYTTVIDSVNTTVINGFTLKCLYGYGSRIITERFGSTAFLFNFKGLYSDGDYFVESLCYKDSVFGLKQFTTKPCDYSNPSGMDELGNNEPRIKVYPNPVADILNIEILNSSSEDLEVRGVNLLGEKVYFTKCQRQDAKFRVALDDLKSGIYFLQLFDKGKLVATEKIIKQ